MIMMKKLPLETSRKCHVIWFALLTELSVTLEEGVTTEGGHSKMLLRVTKHKWVKSVQREIGEEWVENWGWEGGGEEEAENFVDMYTQIDTQYDNKSR